MDETNTPAGADSEQLPGVTELEQHVAEDLGTEPTGHVLEDQREQLRETFTAAPLSEAVELLPPELRHYAVYDNDLLRFVSHHVHAEQSEAHAELDRLRPETGHDLVVVPV